MQLPNEYHEGWENEDRPDEGGGEASNRPKDQSSEHSLRSTPSPNSDKKLFLSCPKSIPELHWFHVLPAMMGSHYCELYEVDPFERRSADSRRGRSCEKGRRRDESQDKPKRRSRSPAPKKPNHQENPMFFPGSDSDGDNNSNQPPVNPVIPKLRRSNIRKTEKAECVCPIDTKCPRLGNKMLDCRSLVARWKSWNVSADQSIQRRETQWWPSPNSLKATTRELNNLLEPLAAIARLPSTRVATLQNNYNKLFDAILTIKDRYVDLQLLNETDAIETVRHWLGSLSLSILRQKRIKSWFVEELAILLRNWKKGDYFVDPNRGLTKQELIVGNGRVKRIRYLLDKEYQHYQKANYYGAGDLINGEVWTSRLQMMRDGAHFATVAGICGTVAGGAYSIVMGLHNPSKKDCYADKDRGRVIWYEGTALPGSDEEWESTNIEDPDMDTRAPNTLIDPTRCTQMLKTSLRKGKPVRVFRSYKLSELVKHRPAYHLFRYDGLYVVTDEKLQKEGQQIWIFKLERRPGQGKLRGTHPNDPRKFDGEPRGWEYYGDHDHNAWDYYLA